MLGNNSCGIHSLLAAKHGRGLRTSDNTHELEVLTYRGVRFRVGATSPERFAAHHSKPAVRAEKYIRQAQGLREQVRRVIRERMPQVAAARFRLQPRCPSAGERLSRGPGAGRLGKHAGDDSRSHAEPGSQPGRAVAARPRLSRRLRGSERHHGHPALEADRARRDGSSALQVDQATRRQAGRSRPDAAWQGVPPSGIRRRQQGRFRRAGPALHGNPAEEEQAAGDEALRRSARGKDGLESAGERPGLDRLGAGPARQLAGLGGLGRAAGEGCRLPCPSCASCSTSTITTRRSTATSARDASTAASASTCTRPRESESSDRSWTRPWTWS